MKQIPNLFTLLNLFLGCLAIVFTLQAGLLPMTDESGLPLTDATGNQYINLPEKIVWASVFIFIAALIDFLDGFVARLFRATSDMGKQLDSLADVVSFGVAPSLIVYQFLRLCFAQEESGLHTSMVVLLPAFILPCAAAWRLARFNLDPDQSKMFKGLPVPAAGILIASFPMIYWYSNQSWQINLLLNKWFWYLILLLLSGLMISRLPLISLKFEDYTVKKNISKIVLVLIAVLAVWGLTWSAIPVILAAYIIVSLLFKK